MAVCTYRQESGRGLAHFRWNLKRNKGLNFLVLAVFLVASLLPVMFNRLALHGGQLEQGALRSTLLVGGIFALVVSVFLPLLYAQRIFGYLNRRNAVDLIHAMPVRRSSLYWQLFLSGALALLGIHVLRVLLTALVYFFLSKGDSAGLSLLYQQLMGVLLPTLLLYAFFSCFIILMGNSFDGLVLALGVEFLLPALYTGVNSYLLLLLPGYCRDLSMNSTVIQFVFGISNDTLPMSLFLFSPHQAFNDFHRGLTGEKTQFLWLLLFGVYLLVGQYLFVRRPSERAGMVALHSHAYHIAHAMAVLISSMLFTGIFFLAGNPHLPLAFCLGSLVGGGLCHCALSMLFGRGFAGIRKNWAYAVLPVVLWAFSLAGIVFDVTGYVHRIPAKEDLYSVRISNMREEDAPEILAENPEIQKVLDLHRNWAETKHRPYLHLDSDEVESVGFPEQEGKMDFQKTTNLYLRYTLKNKREILRQLRIPTSEYRKLMNTTVSTRLYSGPLEHLYLWSPTLQQSQSVDIAFLRGRRFVVDPSKQNSSGYRLRRKNVLQKQGESFLQLANEGKVEEVEQLPQNLPSNQTYLFSLRYEPDENAEILIDFGRRNRQELWQREMDEKSYDELRKKQNKAFWEEVATLYPGKSQEEVKSELYQFPRGKAFAKGERVNPFYVVDQAYVLHDSEAWMKAFQDYVKIYQEKYGSSARPDIGSEVDDLLEYFNPN